MEGQIGDLAPSEVVSFITGVRVVIFNVGCIQTDALEVLIGDPKLSIVSGSEQNLIIGLTPVSFYSVNVTLIEDLIVVSAGDGKISTSDHPQRVVNSRVEWMRDH